MWQMDIGLGGRAVLLAVVSDATHACPRRCGGTSSGGHARPNSRGARCVGNVWRGITRKNAQRLHEVRDHDSKRELCQLLKLLKFGAPKHWPRPKKRTSGVEPRRSTETAQSFPRSWPPPPHTGRTGFIGLSGGTGTPSGAAGALTARSPRSLRRSASLSLWSRAMDAPCR